MSAANRRRGARAEVAVVNYLRDQGWPDARRYLAGDGRQPGDVDWHPLVCLEVKDVARSAWPEWCRQARAEARPGMAPVVVRRTRGVPDVGAWECRVLVCAWPTRGRGTTVDGLLWDSMPFAQFVASVRDIDLDKAAS